MLYNLLVKAMMTRTIISQQHHCYYDNSEHQKSTRWSWPCLSPQHHPSLFLFSLPMVSARWTICRQVQAFCHLNDLIPHSLCLEGFSLVLSDVPFKYRIKYYPFWKTSLVPQAMKVILSLFLQRLLRAQEFLQCIMQLTCVSLKANICWESAHASGIPHEKIAK